MSHNSSFELLAKTPIVKKVIIAFIAILVLSTNGISSMVSAIPDYLDKGLNPIPYSPPPNYKNINEVKTEIIDGLKITQNGAQRTILPESNLRTDNPIRSRINEYAASRHYTATNEGLITSEGVGFQLYYDSQSNLKTSTLLMYPQVRDIIPPTATISEAVLITSYLQENPAIIINLDVCPITSIWDPRQQIVTLPTFGATLAAGIWDTSSRTAQNRVLDVTSTVQSWFDGIAPQWGFKLSTASEQTTENFILQYPPRLYITYWMPSNSYNSTGVAGGTWYDDSICPGMWIPARATYIQKQGVLENSVVTNVIAGSSLRPPFGYDNMSTRWVFDGKPRQSSVFCTPGYFNIQGQSETYMDNVLQNVPPVDVAYFPPPPGAVIGPGDCCARYCPIMDGGTDVIVDPIPDEPPWPTVPHEWRCEWYYESREEQIGDCGQSPSGGGTLPPADSIDAVPPSIKPVPDSIGKIYKWNDLPNQIVAFKQSGTNQLDIVNTAINGWYNDWKMLGNTARVAAGGNTASSFGYGFSSTCGDICGKTVTSVLHNKWTYISTLPVFLENIEPDGLPDG